MHITYSMRICAKCRDVPGSERLSCHLCHRRFCQHSALLGDDAICVACVDAGSVKEEGNEAA
jgi:disulfide oxidoreductase YuzD